MLHNSEHPRTEGILHVILLTAPALKILILKIKLQLLLLHQFGYVSTPTPKGESSVVEGESSQRGNRVGFSELAENKLRIMAAGQVKDLTGGLHKVQRGYDGRQDPSDPRGPAQEAHHAPGRAGNRKYRSKF